MDTKQTNSSFYRDGFLYLENFFDEELMNLYQNKILEHFAQDSEYKHDTDFIEKSNTDVIPWFPQIDELYLSFVQRIHFSYIFLSLLHFQAIA